MRLVRIQVFGHFKNLGTIDGNVYYDGMREKIYPGRAAAVGEPTAALILVFPQHGRRISMTIANEGFGNACGEGQGSA